MYVALVHIEILSFEADESSSAMGQLLKLLDRHHTVAHSHLPVEVEHVGKPHMRHPVVGRLLDSDRGTRAAEVLQLLGLRHTYA